MPSIPLYSRASNSASSPHNPLPQLLQTPSGLAILELQGTINLPSDDKQRAESQPSDTTHDPTAFETPVGKLMFPDYSPQTTVDDIKWMKRVYLYVGRYQRMTGEVKKLAQPLAVVQRRRKQTSPGGSEAEAEDSAEGEPEELEIVEIIKYKLIFKSRPEPVNDN